MGNWYNANPLEGQARLADDKDMLEMIAYITDIRSGYKLEPGKY